MERDGKRKAAQADTHDSEQRAPKRQRLPGASSSDETPETTREMGLKFVEALKSAKDKTGRPIATHFITLPDKDELPEYYEEIALPISVETIEDKLNRRKYPTMAAVESDAKRMINNAKTFNDKSSLIHMDAERLRKTASNFMVKHNPAYKDAHYSAVATPLPEEGSRSTPTQSNGTTLRLSAPKQPLKGQAISQPTASGPEISAAFQEAQEQMIDKLIDYTDPENGLQEFFPFVNLPPRSLTDYYQLIKEPTSLKGIQKRIRGIHGRNAPTGVTDFKSWDAFEEAVSYIWKNAREYNEDGSEMYELAGGFEEMFKELLTNARATVEEPPQPKLKLNMSASAPKPSIKLKLGVRGSPAPTSHSNSPAPRDSNTPGVIVDNEALRRQQQHVQAGINGDRPPSSDPAAQRSSSRNPFGSSRPGSAAAPIPPLARESSGAPLTNGVKNEAVPSPSPNLGAIRPTSAAPMAPSGQTPHLSASAMPPPALAQRISSGSPLPQGPPAYAQPSQNQYYQSYYAPPTQAVENKYRSPGKTAADALLPLVTIQSHPTLNLPHPRKLNIPAHKKLTQQSFTVSLQSMHHYLQIIPTVPVALTQQPWRLFVTINGTKLSEVVRPTVDREDKGSKRLFEARLIPGTTNRIEIEVITTAKGKASDQLEKEKCTVNVFLTR